MKVKMLYVFVELFKFVWSVYLILEYTCFSYMTLRRKRYIGLYFVFVANILNVCAFLVRSIELWIHSV